MYLLVSAALSMTMWGWWAINPLIFFAGIFFATGLTMYLDISKMVSKDGLFDTAISTMTTTDCCLVHRVWSEPTSVRWTSATFKMLAGLDALCSTYVTWRRKDRFVNGHYMLISVLWVSVALLWICSCIPMFICLVQCATNPKLNRKQLDISGQELILRFRKVYALWLLHDVVLGVFWLYLSVMLFDLADDQDDSEWRTIFLSMISWHIVIILLYSVYFEPLDNIYPKTFTNSKVSPCCSPEKATSLWKAMVILSYAGMYSIVVLRIQQDALLELGFNSALYPVVFSCAALLYGTSRLYITRHSHPIQTPELYKSPPPVLDLSVSGLDF